MAHDLRTHPSTVFRNVIGTPSRWANNDWWRTRTQRQRRYLGFFLLTLAALFFLSSGVLSVDFAELGTSSSRSSSSSSHQHTLGESWKDVLDININATHASIQVAVRHFLPPPAAPAAAADDDANNAAKTAQSSSNGYTSPVSIIPTSSIAERGFFERIRALLDDGYDIVLASDDGDQRVIPLVQGEHAVGAETSEDTKRLVDLALLVEQTRELTGQVPQTLDHVREAFKDPLDKETDAFVYLTDFEGWRLDVGDDFEYDSTTGKIVNEHCNVTVEVCDSTLLHNELTRTWSRRWSESKLDLVAETPSGLVTRTQTLYRSDYAFETVREHIIKLLNQRDTVTEDDVESPTVDEAASNTPLTELLRFWLGIADVAKRHRPASQSFGAYMREVGRFAYMLLIEGAEEMHLDSLHVDVDSFLNQAFLRDLNHIGLHMTDVEHRVALMVPISRVLDLERKLLDAGYVLTKNTSHAEHNPDGADPNLSWFTKWRVDLKHLHLQPSSAGFADIVRRVDARLAEQQDEAHRQT